MKAVGVQLPNQLLREIIPDHVIHPHITLSVTNSCYLILFLLPRNTLKPQVWQEACPILCLCFLFPISKVLLVPYR